MGKPNFSALLPLQTLQEIEELKPLYNGNKTQIVIQAIKLLHRQEKPTMITSTITVTTINTQPEHDPYVNLGGHSSYTVLRLDPEDQTIGVRQEYRDNSTPEREWNGRILTWKIPTHPSESDMREYIQENMPVFERIIVGYECEWNGHNHVGRLTEEAHADKEMIQAELDQDVLVNQYEYWEADQWLENEDVDPNATDEQLATIAAGLESDAKHANVVLDEDVLDWLKSRRDYLKSEQDDNE